MSRRARRRLRQAPPENGGMVTFILAMLWLMVTYVLRHPATLDYWEGFDEWGLTTAEAGIRGWNTSSSSPSTQTGRFSGLAYRWPNNSTTLHTFAVSSTRQTIGFAWRISNQNTTYNIASLREGATTHGTLTYNGNGTFSITRAGTALTGGTTANLGIASATWYYIEWDYTCADSPNGNSELRVNEVSVATVSGQDTRNGGTSGTLDTLAIGSPNATAIDWDDYYEASGSTSFQGDCRVITDMPNSDGTQTDWTPSTGTDHFAVVDEIPYNSDTDYVSTSTATADDTYGFPSLGITGDVLGVMTQAMARKDDAGTRNLALIVDSNGTFDVGSSQALTASYAPFRRTDLQDPGAGPGAWTVTAVNAAEYGMRNV